MKLSELISGLGLGETLEADPQITGVTRDSREVEPGSLFVAVKGAHEDGRDFIADAVKRGAGAVVSEPPLLEGLSVPVCMVPQARIALARLARSFYRSPADALLVTGITGTNGKTTTAFLCTSILEASGMATGMLGSILYKVGDEVTPAKLTTPEAPDVQRMMAEMLEAGQKACVLEVSSHGVAQNRVEGIAFDFGLFTNLDRDHLDYHGDMDRYFRAKARFFEMISSSGTAVLNADDPAFARMRSFTRASVVTFSARGKADLRLMKAHCTSEGTRVSVDSPLGHLELESRLVGRHNASNILAAASFGCAASVKPEAIITGVRAVDQVPGRLEPVTLGQPFRVWIDFAHTAHALAHCLRSLREFAPSRSIVVFGCGGDRDAERRFSMGEKAARLSDLAVITSDNPRSEDPLAIIEQIKQGVCSVRKEGYLVIPDRREAIRKALREAGPGDSVLIAGKGHEAHQIIGRQRLPMDDRQEAESALRQMGYGG